MTFPVMSTMPKEQRPSFRVWNRWMVYTQDTIQQSIEKKMTIKTINKWLAEEGLSTMIIKGFSVASLYPNIMLRESCDIDIYSGSMSDAVNACFVKHGVPMDNPDGHHWHFFDTMTAIGLHRFGLPAEWFPAEEVEMAEGIDPELEQRVWNDTTDLLRMKRSGNSTVRRLTIAGRMLENRWKFNAFSDIGVGRYLWNVFRGWIKAKD